MNSPKFTILLTVMEKFVTYQNWGNRAELWSKEQSIALRKKCLYSEFFWSAFFRIRTEYGNLQSKSPFSLLMWGNTDQKLRIRTLFTQLCGWDYSVKI